MVHTQKRHFTVIDQFHPKKKWDEEGVEKAHFAPRENLKQECEECANARSVLWARGFSPNDDNDGGRGGGKRVSLPCHYAAAARPPLPDNHANIVRAKNTCRRHVYKNSCTQHMCCDMMRIFLGIRTYIVLIPKVTIFCSGQKIQVKRSIDFCARLRTANTT